MIYRNLIKELAPTYNPAHVEAWIRLEHGTMCHLSRNRFESEVKAACDCIDSDPDTSVALAESYGLC